MNGVQEIARERIRQSLPKGTAKLTASGGPSLILGGKAIIGQVLNGEGYYSEHDDAHVNKELVRNAVDVLYSYLNGPGLFAPAPGNDEWELGRKHNADPRKLLVVAGALIAAEIDRWDRATEKLVDKLRRGVRR
jgi:hypothetical protein